MKMVITGSVLLGLFLQLGTCRAGDGCGEDDLVLNNTALFAKPDQQEAGAAALEQKLVGVWKGAPCAGNYTFKADRTFVLDSFTPGGNTLTGKWSTRWDAIPPTLILNCETSDFTAKNSTREEFTYLGRPLEVKLVELNNEVMALRVPAEKSEKRFARVLKK